MHTDMRYASGVSAWTIRIAHVVPLLAVPSGIWRIALGLGIPVGFTGELARLYAAPGWITPYVIVLTLLSELACMTSFAYVQEWGVTAPRWVPYFGGRRWPTWLVVGAGGVLVIVVAVGTAITVLAWNGPENMGDPDSPQGAAGLLMTLAYAPMVAWAPLLAVLVLAYAMRRRSRS